MSRSKIRFMLSTIQGRNVIFSFTLVAILLIAVSLVISVLPSQSEGRRRQRTGPRATPTPEVVDPECFRIQTNLWTMVNGINKINNFANDNWERCKNFEMTGTQWAEEQIAINVEYNNLSAGYNANYNQLTNKNCDQSGIPQKPAQAQPYEENLPEGQKTCRDS